MLLPTRHFNQNTFENTKQGTSSNGFNINDLKMHTLRNSPSKD